MSPDVPRETTQVPSFTAPAPSALIWLSPLPGATATSPLSPSSRAISGLRCPTICGQTTAFSMGFPRRGLW